MANQHTNAIANKIVTEACLANPLMPARTLARQLYTKNPTLWPNLDACRQAINARFGKMGKKNKGSTKVTRPNRSGGDDWKKFLPSARQTINLPWGPVAINGPCKALILSDLHVPFYDQQAVELAINYGIDRGADVVILNGDVMDHYSISRWQPDPRLRSFADEVHDARTLIHAVRLAFPDSQIYWKLGNHEERYEAYMISHAPAFLGIEAFEWENLFGLKHENIHLIADKRPITLGKLHVIHGHELNTSFSNPVNPARGFFLKAGTHVLGGHYHQTSQHSKNNLEDNVVSAWSTGALCEPHPKYRPINDWNAGFAFVETDARGAFHVENKRIVDGGVW